MQDLTEYTAVRINKKIKDILKEQANIEGRTLSGIINDHLKAGALKFKRSLSNQIK